MGMPPQDMPDTGPVNFDMIMRLRNAARGGPSMEGAAKRKLGQFGEPAPTDPTQELVDGKTPEDMVMEDIEKGINAVNEPPDITITAATTMQRYGAIQEYLMRAKGEMPSA